MAGSALPNDVTPSVARSKSSSSPYRREDRTVVANKFPGAGIGDVSVATLVEGAAEGDQHSWRELVLRFGGMIASVGRRYGLSQADIGELQQTTWLRLVENLHRIEQPERVGGWLATTASRQSLQLVKRASRFTVGADQMLANLPDDHTFEIDALPAGEERKALMRGWSRLKPRCQELLALLISDEAVGYKELSHLLDMPIGSIGPTRARCLEHLRRLIAEEGITKFEA